MRNEADRLQHEQWLDAIISLEEAARLRGIHVKTLRSEILRGALKDIRISKKRLGHDPARGIARLKMLISGRPVGSALPSTAGLTQGEIEKGRLARRQSK